MPLTSKGNKIMANMKKTYKSKEKAESVFYASINSGKISGVEGSKKAGAEHYKRRKGKK